MNSELTVLENELIPVYITNTGEKVVYGSELFNCLCSKGVYREWSRRRFSDCDAVENEDFEGVEISTPSGQTRKDHVIKLDTAKEMAMLERSENGKRVRKYFIEVEKKYQENQIDTNQLPPELRLMNMLVQSMNRAEIEQQRQAEKITALEDKADKQGKSLENIKDTFTQSTNDEELTRWIRRCINRIAESPNFTYSFGNRYAAAKSESYKRLTDKAHCRLDQKVRNAITRAEERGCTRAQINSINKLSIILADRRLREIYITVIKEMMLAYCVEV